MREVGSPPTLPLGNTGVLNGLLTNGAYLWGMIMMATAAILGAALGLFVRPKLLGVLIPVLLVGVIEGVALFIIGLLGEQPNRELLIARLQSVFGESVIDAVAPMSTAFVGAVLAALMGAFTDGERSAALVTADGLRRKAGKNGRYARVHGMVEEREIHEKAESRIDSILGL